MAEGVIYTLLGLTVVAVALLLLSPWAAVGLGLFVVIVNEYLTYRANQREKQ